MTPLITAYIIVLVVLIFLSMFFSSADMAYGSVSENRLKKISLENPKSKTKARAYKLTKNYDKTISTILLFNDTINAGIDTISTLLGIEVAIELLGISSWILAAFGAVFSYAHMQPIMQKFIENEKLAGLCGSVLIALIILVIMTLINSHINKKLRQSSLSGLDRILGMIFGVIRAVLLMALVYIGISVAISDDQMEELKKSNVSLVYIQKTVNFMKKLYRKTFNLI